MFKKVLKKKFLLPCIIEMSLNLNSELYSDRILQVKTLTTMKKYFLHDVIQQSKKFATQTLGKTIKMINRQGVTKKQLISLYNDVKPIMYGSSLNQSIKKIRAESIGNILPFGDEVFEYNRNKQPEKVTFSNNDVTITKSIYKNVADERIININ